jgi:hypothetical protein
VQSQLDEKHVESEMLKASTRVIVCIVDTAYIVQAMEGFIEHFDSISDENIRQFLVSFAEQELQPDLSVRKAADRVAFQAMANHRCAPSYNCTPRILSSQLNPRPSFVP